jgi:hypothetical protein
MLNFSSRLKEKYLCNPIEAMPYIIATDYFYKTAQATTTIATTTTTILMTSLTTAPSATTVTSAMLNNVTNSLQTDKPLSKDKLANYNLASLICKLPKSQLISDLDVFVKEINLSILSNYVVIIYLFI